MKSLKLLIIAITATTFGIAQEVDVTLETQTGYESNILQSPESLEVNGTLFGRDALWQNSVYQDTKARIGYKIEGRNNRWKFSASTNNRFYFEASDINRLTANLGIHHRYAFNKKTKLETEIGYRFKEQRAINNDEDILRTPFSYNLYFARTGLHFRLFKSNRTYVGGDFTHKNYYPTETRDFLYNAWAVEFNSKNVFWRNHKLHQYGFEFSFQNRNYDETSLTQANISNRNWQYTNLRLFYSYPISEQLKIEPSIAFLKRNDNTNGGNASYFQWSPRLALNYQTEDWRVKTRASYRNRRFSDVFAVTDAGPTNEEVNYDYVLFSADVERRLAHRLWVTFTGSTINRWSNQTAITRQGFRSYQNYYLGVGIKWQF